MTYFATGDRIGKGTVPDGAIEIGAEQYQTAFAAKMEGRETVVIDGDLVLRDPAPSPNHTWENDEWVAPPEPEPEPPTEEELDAIAKHAAENALKEIMAEDVVRDESLPVETRRKVAPIFPRWQVDEVVVVDTFRRFEGGLYRCVQAHTTQEDWAPPQTPALWTETVPSGTVGPWKQPQGDHDAYQVGDKVKHNNKTWTSTHANNVWEPGVFGWMEEA